MSKRASFKGVLSVEAVSKRRGTSEVLHEVSLTIATGETVALLGPSGGGKTTLAEVIAGILVPESGRIVLDGQDVTLVPPHVRRIPIAPQDWDLFPHLTALENVEFGLRVAGENRSHRREKAARLLDEIGLADRIDSYPHQLSGGQQQRVCFARALAVPSPYLIVDEPFASVDQDTRTDLRAVLARTVASGRGVLFITHDRVDALQMADRIVCLVAGQVIMTGTPKEVYGHPKDLDVALLTGDAFLLPATAVARETDGRTGALLVRPEWLVLTPPSLSARWTGVIQSTLYQGDHYLLGFVAAGVNGQLRSEVSVPIGQQIGIDLRSDVTPQVLDSERPKIPTQVLAGDHASGGMR